MKENNKTYAAILRSGINEDCRDHYIFISDNKQTVLKWVRRLNTIIARNKQRIFEFDKTYDWSDFTQKTPLWYNLIRWEDPMAFVFTIEVR